MRFKSFMKEIKKHRRMVEKRQKRTAYELSNPSTKPVRKKIRSSHPSSLSPLSPTSSSSPSSPPTSLSPSLPPSSLYPSSLLSPSSPPSSLSLSSASSSCNWTHDVFPSFRGEDVRSNFLSHIKKEFERKGITMFIDNKIERGESIGPELIRAIRGSKISIILISKNYASSKWCLDELVEIMKCREELNQSVMAIFYKVDPSHVKKLTGNFGKVFRKTCEGQTKEYTECWRQALEKVATIAGYHSSTWDNEADMIESITADVSTKLINSVPSSDFDNFVGMSTHMKNMERLLRLGSNEVRIIGIWGPSGIGKSTIARVLFTKHSHDFQLSVFMDDIKRRYPRLDYNDYSMKLKLQNEFLSQIINQKDIKIHHLGVVQDRLKDKRVLAVLDDVDHLVHLDAMVKETQWFGPGSRIIITTQDKKILKARRIQGIYEVGFPPDDEALQIFCMNAFGKNSPCDGFEKLAFEVTRLAGNLPLGLSVMGSYFKGMSKQDWEEELPRLRTRLDGDIESILKFSYDAICDEDQALFLHIACFFNRETIEKVEAYLSENFVGVKGRLRVLAEKSLISIDWMGFVEMHELLAGLGREIVRKQSPNEPGKRQFLVDARDICRVLRNDTLGSRSVIGIDLKLSELETELKVSDGAFEKMSNVQFLRIDSEYQDSDDPRNPIPYELESVNYRHPTLRLLHWDSCPMTCLPSNFNPEFLVEINMLFSNLERLWEGTKTITNLKWMDLRDSSNLKELPDLSTATNLRELSLSRCLSLVKLPSSVGNMINLVDLRLSSCTSLVELPSSIGNMTNLVELHLDGCSSLVELPSSFGNLHSVSTLQLEGCSKLKALPININMKSLDKLDLTGCLLLKSFPDISTNIRYLWLNGTAIEEIPSSIRSWSRFCGSRRGFDSIRELHLSDTGIQEIAPWFKEMSRLQKLVISRCTKLVSLPQLPDSLKFLDAVNCESLERLDCLFYKAKFDELGFVNCFKLNQEARDLLIIKTSTKRCAVFPGEKLPPYFTYRATGSSLSMKPNGSITHFPTSREKRRFKACVLLVNKGGVEAGDWRNVSISYCIKNKLNGVIVNSGSSRSRFGLPPISKKHLVIFEFETIMTSTELVFEFGLINENWDVEECGLRIPESLAPYVLL